jgi:hypothetical protein
MEVAIFTDHDTVRWDYGFFPARRIIGWITGWIIARASGRTSSVHSFGPERYVALLDELDKKYPEVIVVPGVEAIPFFYWEGGLLSGRLAMVNGYKHLLAFGMPNAEDFENLPSVGDGFFRRFGVEGFLSLWPLVLLYLGHKCLRGSGTSALPALRRYPGLLFLAVGALFLLNNFPYTFGKYDQYHGDQGVAPYQDFIDYVAGRGGLVFWAHPEVTAEKTVRLGPVVAGIRTDAYYTDLLQTQNYTGFAAFAEGMKYVIPPGGVWDRVLLEYCVGLRERPAWAIGEGDVEGAAFSPKETQTVFLLKERSRAEVLDALREGRVYAVTGLLADDLSVTDFTLSCAGETVHSGEGLEAEASKVQLSAVLQCRPIQKGHHIKVDIIRDGQVVRSLKGEGTLEITHADDLGRDGRMHYYRLDVRAPRQTRLVTNPIFVRAPARE